MIQGISDVQSGNNMPWDLMLAVIAPPTMKMGKELNPEMDYYRSNSIEGEGPHMMKLRC